MYELRWYQQAAVDATWGALEKLPGNPVIVLPTGAGKSLIIAELCRHAWQEWGVQSLVLAHRKELLTQNAEKIQSFLKDEIEVGFYSAGLRSRDTDHPIICAGIQSAYKRAEEFGDRRMVIIDECHLIRLQDDGMYRDFLRDLKAHNPKIRTIGLTATPYRASEGIICRHDGIFQRISYNAPVARLMKEGYLCKIYNHTPKIEFDTSGLHSRGGDFIPREMETLFNGNPGKIEIACQEIVEKTSNRNACLVFCAGVDHAYNVAGRLGQISGKRSEAVTGETPALMRSALLGDFKAGLLPYLVNCDVLTTGFDAPNIDTIAVLRATQSPGLFAQICGRGFRVHETKTNCLYLDFGENLKRHGPLDSPTYGHYIRFMAGKGGPVSKECPSCREVIAAGIRVCPCGHVFPPREPNHFFDADAESEILQEAREWIVVKRSWHQHTKRNKNPGDPDTVRIDYVCVPDEGDGNLREKHFSEWICPDHKGFAREKFEKWWYRMSRVALPGGVDECLDMMDKGSLADVASITVKKDGRWDRVINHQIGERPGFEDLVEGVKLDEWEASIPF